ncbi:hypothetical protein [Haliangium sp.]|uniref:hypothetical protein n=1 Tax=Haliangium sp. TaxID=2663208 RepID=UPI003D0F5D2F
MSIAIDWDAIEPTREAWSAVLDSLLDQARVAATGTVDERQAVIDALSSFIAYSPSGLSGKLDVLARLTADELFTASAEALMHSIDERRGALDRIRTGLDSSKP